MLQKYHQKLSLKYWAEEDRPREKLLNKGKHDLSTTELLAIIIGSGNRGETAVELAQKLFSDAEHNLIELSKKSTAELMKYKGIGPSKAVSIAAALELGKRLLLSRSDTAKQKQIRSSQDIYQLCQPKMAHLIHEEFWVIFLNRANRIIKNIKISSGGISGTVVDIRLILKSALDHLASAIILSHNHPSGNTKPSQADIQLTGKMKKAAELMDITILDHLIIGGNQYFSFADEGML